MKRKRTSLQPGWYVVWRVSNPVDSFFAKITPDRVLIHHLGPAVEQVILRPSEWAWMAMVIPDDLESLTHHRPDTGGRGP